MVLQLIFLSGYNRCGKDTLANHLSTQYGFTHMKISQPLKDSLKVLFNLTDDQLENNSKDEIDTQWGVTPRDIMKFIGTDIFQFKINELLPHKGRNFWIDLLLNTIKSKYLNTDSKIVVSDLRFTHEYLAVRDFMNMYSELVDVKLVKIVHVGATRLYQQDKHNSETEHLQFQYDIILENEKNKKDVFLNKAENVLVKCAS